MKKAISILLLLLLCFPAYSQDESLTDSVAEQKTKQIEIYFDWNSYVIDLTYMNNEESIRMLIDATNAHSTDSSTEIIEVVLCSYSSPDGGLKTNTALTQKRADTIYKYLTEICSVPDSLITVNNCDIAWDLMREYIVATSKS